MMLEKDRPWTRKDMEDNTYVGKRILLRKGINVVAMLQQDRDGSWAVPGGAKVPDENLEEVVKAAGFEIKKCPDPAVEKKVVVKKKKVIH